MKNVKKFSFGIILLLVMIVAVGCGDSSTGGEKGNGDDANEKKNSNPENVTILAGETGGTYYVSGAGVAEIMNKNFGDQYNTTVQSTGGAIDNLMQIVNKQADIAYGPSTVLNDAYKGINTMYEVIEEPHEDLRMVWYMYPMPMHIIAMDDSGIETIEDLKGKKVAATPGAAVASITELFEKYFGLNENDYEIVPIGFSDGVSMLTDGNVDVLAYYAGAPTPTVMELMSQHEIQYVSIPEDALSKLISERPVYTPFTFTGDVYEGITSEVTTYASSVVLFAHKDTPDEKVYTVAKAIHENIQELTEMHSSGANATLENFDLILKNPFIPIHSGTETYLEELGHSY